jgi:membrane protein DedA with SNARE-associated domain
MNWLRKAIMLSNDLAIYLAAFVGPFVQEDAAIIGAVTAFLHPDMNKVVSGPLVLSAMVCGLIMSDLWKYWIGWAGQRQAWARKIADKPSVLLIGEKIKQNPGKTLLLARFIPGTRIPAYIAAGFVGVPFLRYAFWIVTSALAYVAAACALLSGVSAAIGSRGQIILAVTLGLGLTGYMVMKRAKAGAASK